MSKKRSLLALLTLLHNLQSMEQRNPLWIAIKNDRLDIVQTLLEEEPLIYQNNLSNKSPLDYARELKRAAIIEFLLKHGCTS